MGNDLPEPRADGLNRRDWTIALAVAGLTALLHVALADRRGLWCDEYFTLYSAQMSLADQWRDRIGAGHSPLYFIYSRLGLLFGESTRALRSTSALAGAAAILGLTGMAGAMGLRRVLPVLWPLAALEPYWLNLGTNMRYMMPMLAAATLTTWAAAAHAARGRRRDGAFLALATALLLWLHASAQFFALGLLIFILWEEMARPGGSVWRGLGRAWPVAAGILASLPLLYLIRHHSSYLKPEFPKFRDIKRDLLEVVFNDYRLWPRFFHFSDRGIYYAEIVLLAAAVALAYWELRRRPTARRLLLATLTAVPAGFVLTCGLVRDFQGPERYLLLFGLPAVVCMAVAWQAGVAPALRWAYRALLIGVLAVQSMGAALERGDRHREACHWVVENYSARESILASISRPTRLGLVHYGLDPRAEESIFRIGSALHDSKDIRPIVEQALARGPRVFYVYYFSGSPLLKVLGQMEKEGRIAGRRQWRLSSRTTVGALIGDKAEQAWLDALPPPSREWGPARED